VTFCEEVIVRLYTKGLCELFCIAVRLNTYGQETMSKLSVEAFRLQPHIQKQVAGAGSSRTAETMAAGI